MNRTLRDVLAFFGLLLLLGVFVAFSTGCHCAREVVGPEPVAAPNVPLTNQPLVTQPTEGPGPKAPQPEPPQQPEPPSHEPKPTPTPLPPPTIPGCLCHKDKVTLCDLPDGARAAHLAHGDYVGQCR